MYAASFLIAVYFDSRSQSHGQSKQGENMVYSETFSNPKDNVSDV